MKKCAVALLLILCLLRSGWAVAADYQVLMAHDSNIYEENGVPLARLEAEFPQVTGLVDAHAMNRVNAAIRDSVRLSGGYDGVCEVARGDYEAGMLSVPERMYGLTVCAEAAYENGRLLSVVYQYSADTGGVHPETWYGTGAYDLQTGETVALELMVKDMEAFRAQVADAVLTALEGSPLVKEGRLFDGYGDVVRAWRAEQILLGKDGLTVIFSPYQIAPYVEGMQKVTVSYDQLAGQWSDLGRMLIDK